MVGTHDLVIDGSSRDLVSHPVGCQEIVDAPAGIILPCLEPVAPPGVGSRHIRVQMPEGIRKAGIQELAEALPFLVGEAGAATVGGRIFQVDLIVCYIQITADDDRFLAVQLDRKSVV